MLVSDEREKPKSVGRQKKNLFTVQGYRARFPGGCGLAFTEVKNIWLDCCAPGSFMTVCGSQRRLHMHSDDPVELGWPWKARGGEVKYKCIYVENQHAQA